MVESPGTGSPQSGGREQARGRFWRRRRRRHALGRRERGEQEGQRPPPDLRPLQRPQPPVSRAGLSRLLQVASARLQVGQLRWLCVAECLLLLLKSEMVGWNEVSGFRIRIAGMGYFTDGICSLSSQFFYLVMHVFPCVHIDSDVCTSTEKYTNSPHTNEH